jgi:hypothetical protein
MPRLRPASLAPSVALMVLLGGTVMAQEPAADARLDPAVRAAIEQTVAEATSQGLPTEPLIDKALEGMAKGAAPSRIVAAVRTLASGLASARRELGPATRPADLVAGAEALRAGVEPAALGRLRQSRPSASLLMPLVVLADLISRGVPVDAAADAVLVLAGRGASDAEFGAMQQEIHHDIQAGAPPATAAAVRSRGRGKSGGDKPAGAGPKSPGRPAEATPITPGKPGVGKPDGPPKRPPKRKPPKSDRSPPVRD